MIGIAIVCAFAGIVIATAALTKDENREIALWCGGGVLVVALIVWAFTLIPGPSAPPPLPPHVKVGPDSTFLVDKGYTGLGKILCYNGGHYSVRTFSDGQVVICKQGPEYGAHDFSYSKDKIWTAN